MASVALITGGSGLLGRHLLRSWNADLEPLLVHHHEHDLLAEGVARALVARVRPNVVVHLAWAASGTPGYRTCADNDRWAEVSLELARAATDAGAHFCATGTALDGNPPSDAYSAAKVWLRRALQPEIAAETITWLRPYYVVDPELRRPDLVAHAMAAADAGRPVALRTPEQAHDFVHAEDVGRGIMTAVDRSLLGEVPLGSGTARRVRQLVEALGIAWHPDEDAVAAPHHHDVADTTRLRAHGWSPTTTKELFHGE